MTRSEALALADQLREYRATSAVAGGRDLAAWVAVREARLDTVLKRADEALSRLRDAESPLVADARRLMEEVVHALEQVVAEVRA